jgi:hypothetical protein
MSHPKLVVTRSVVQALGHAGVACAVGLVGLPLVFGGPLEVGSLRAWVWLVLAAATGAWLLLPAPVLIEALARVLARLPSQHAEHQPHIRPSAEAASLLLAAAYVVLLQAVARPAVVNVFGPSAEPFVIEAVLGATVLLLLLALLAWLHQTARPLVEGLARTGLDAVLATSGSERARAATATQPRRVTVEVPTMPEVTRRSAQPTQSAQTETVTRRPGRRGGLNA